MTVAELQAPPSQAIVHTLSVVQPPVHWAGHSALPGAAGAAPHAAPPAPVDAAEDSLDEGPVALLLPPCPVVLSSEPQPGGATRERRTRASTGVRAGWTVMGVSARNDTDPEPEGHYPCKARPLSASKRWNRRTRTAMLAPFSIRLSASRRATKGAPASLP